MYNNVYKKIAEGLRLMEEGYLELAENTLPETGISSKKGSIAKQVDKPKSEDIVKKEEVIKKEPANGDPVITIEMVRAVMAEKSKDGKTKEIRELLHKYGAEKLSAVKTSDYSNLLQDVEVL